MTSNKLKLIFAGAGVGAVLGMAGLTVATQMPTLSAEPTEPTAVTTPSSEEPAAWPPTDGAEPEVGPVPEETVIPTTTTTLPPAP
ncbi:MAG: hypothetical protein PGN27_07320 [Mycolicibacterium neoaurum]|uniref:hypothetical protein n=1 Tax=Mycolicibacterium neoaurum TaxID=1795 RepID=UPI002FF59D2E